MSTMVTVTPTDVFNLIEREKVKFVDLRFTDLLGKEQHLSIMAHTVDEDFFTHGRAFDGSSIRGFTSIHKSDMVLMPDVESAVLDPFCIESTLNIRCDVVEPSTLLTYSRCPRGTAKRAEEYLKRCGFDKAYFGPEPEFFIFDSAQYAVEPGHTFYKIDSEEAYWNSKREYEGGNMGHRPGLKGGYFPVPPVDSQQDLRSAMCLTLEQMGLSVEMHHHEVASAGQNEIGVLFDSLLKKADHVQIMKYVIHNTAHAFGKTATFMAKPLVGDNGSGMHCHQSLSKDGVNVFAGDGYAGLSDTALYYIGGIIKHAKALNAFANSTTNSYKRLVPGFEAPTLLAYSACNRSASIRIPYVMSPKGRRIEVRFPDPSSNPYLLFAAMLMAGLDGIRHKIHPGEPSEKDLYDLPPEELQDIPHVCTSLSEALDALEEDRQFLLEGDVFSNDLLDTFIALKRQEITRLNSVTHPVEFEMYYSS